MPLIHGILAALVASAPIHPVPRPYDPDGWADAGGIKFPSKGAHDARIKGGNDTHAPSTPAGR